MVSERFQRGFREVSERFETSLFSKLRLLEGHPKAFNNGFRGVSEGSETLPFFKKVPEWLYDLF